MAQITIYIQDKVKQTCYAGARGHADVKKAAFVLKFVVKGEAVLLLREILWRKDPHRARSNEHTIIPMLTRALRIYM